MTLPLFARKFIVDFVETGVAALLAFSFAYPATLDQAQAIAAAAGTALVAAAISAARRNAGGMYAWLRDKLGVAES